MFILNPAFKFLKNTIKPINNDIFYISIILAGVGLIIEIAFQYRLSKKESKHGPKFTPTKNTNGINIGNFNRNVIPKHIRHFVPKINNDVTLPYNRLSRGITILGDMGCGKSRLMAIIHETLRERYPKIPILIHDPKGEWLRTYYNAETDLIFAPFDNRSVSWRIWDDFKRYPELRHPIISTAIVSHHSGQATDRFWSDSGILLLKDIAQQSTIFDGKEELRQLKEQNSQDKTWMSIYTTSVIGFRDIATVELMNTENHGFSIDDFLNHKGRIFLLNNPSISNEQHGSLTLLLSAFMIRILAGPDVKENDLSAAVFLDEALTFYLPTDIETAIYTQSRSKGLCVVAGTQRLPKENQGERGAWANHPSHIFGMRVTDLHTRQTLTKLLGGIKYEEKQKSISAGDNSTSKTESTVQRQHEAMAPEDWGALQDREFILFHEHGITPGKVKDVFTEQKDNILVIDYNPRKDVTDFMLDI